MDGAPRSFHAPIAEQIWDMKYRLKRADGVPVDQIAEDTWSRVAAALASVEEDPVRWAERFYAAMEDWKFIPAGRILAGAGTGRDVTLFNCFVMGTIDDSMDGIFSALREAALTMQQGGGIGYDFSTIRPRGALVRGVSAEASGPLSFMDCWDAMCRTVMSAGSRRGAMMATLRCLSGDSLVHTLDGRKPIRDLIGTRPYVYACDTRTNQVRIVRADRVFVSDTNRPMVRVHFDDFTHLDCTPDHRVMLRSGEYREAGNLSVGDRIMSITHTIRTHGNDRYIRTVGCSDGKAEYEHRIVARDILGATVDRDHHVHHVNENPLDNRPENLQSVTRSEHAKLHNRNLVRVQAATAAKRKGKTLEQVYGRKKAEQWKRRYREARRRGVEDRIDQNHRVVRIEVIEDAEQVYDISLPEFHNFAVNGVFVHNCDHPDILDFVEAKRDPARLRMFNLSVLCTDGFMQAVDEGMDWDLEFDGELHRTIPARELWDRITRATYDVAEPGVIFIDRINKANNLYDKEYISATNPCGEQPLPSYGACLLGSINLAALVQDRFGPEAGIDPEELRQLVATAVRMLDNVVDVSRFPLEAQAEEARAKRRIGLGVTGLADALVFCGERYGSERAAILAGHWLAEIELAAYGASAALAEEKGPYPIFDAERFQLSENGRRLPEPLRDRIRATGLRNSHLTSIAPTGTISLVAGNVSSGIEPIFALDYTRKVLQPDGSKTEETVEDYAVSEWRRLRGDEPLPDHIVTAQDLTPADHIAMQAAAQRHIDSSISKTINCPADIAFEDFQQVYRDAYDGGCKGCTTYRPNAVTGSVLSTPEPGTQTPERLEADLLDRPEVVPGKTYKLRWPDSPHAIYVTVGDHVTENGSRRPIEVFINSKNMEHHAWTTGLTRMISAIFRRGGEVAFVVEELKAVFDPRGGGWINGKYVPSVLAAIGGVIERHMIETGFLAYGVESDTPVPEPDPEHPAPPPPTPCPACGSFNVRAEGGCLTCVDCGFSKCG